MSKKVISTFIVSIMLVVSVFSVNVFAENKSSDAFYGTPTLDGEMESMWYTSPVMHVNTNQPTFLETGATAEVRALWSETHLYLFAIIYDSTPTHLGTHQYIWHRDSLEIVVDEGNDKGEVYDADDVQFMVDIDGNVHGQTNVDSSKINAAVIDTSTGYIVELSYEFKTAKTEGQVIGMDLQVNDDIGNGIREGRMGWSETEANMWNNPSVFGNLSLLGDSEVKTATAQKGTPTLDAEMEGLWDDAVVMDVIINQPTFLESGATAEVRALWSETHLYLFAIIYDSTPTHLGTHQYIWHRDSLEVVIDEGNEKGQVYDPNDVQFMVDIDGNVHGQTNVDSSMISAAVADTATGYIVELAYEFKESKRDWQVIGMDLQTNDDIGNGLREGRKGWSETEANMWNNPSVFGNLVLLPTLADPGEPDPTATPTATPSPTIPPATPTSSTSPETSDFAGIFYLIPIMICVVLSGLVVIKITRNRI